MSLFQLKDFIMNSGLPGYFKIECDYLTDMDVETFAKIISTKLQFSEVYGVPRGGNKLASALKQYQSDDPSAPVLIVDDVLTTGGSMERFKSSLQTEKNIIGVVMFARNKPADWIQSVFQMW